MTCFLGAAGFVTTGCGAGCEWTTGAGARVGVDGRGW
jgi:hypothetical protein